MLSTRCRFWLRMGGNMFEKRNLYPGIGYGHDKIVVYRLRHEIYKQFLDVDHLYGSYLYLNQASL